MSCVFFADHFQLMSLLEMINLRAAAPADRGKEMARPLTPLGLSHITSHVVKV
jgi:hypothetical protein